jgi:hypothetical protein
VAAVVPADEWKKRWTAASGNVGRLVLQNVEANSLA